MSGSASWTRTVSAAGTVSSSLVECESGFDLECYRVCEAKPSFSRGLSLAVPVREVLGLAVAVGV